MRQSVAQQILTIQDRLRECQEYKELMAEYRQRDERLTALLSRLEEDEQSVILDYLWVGIDIHIHMLELACETANTNK